MLFEVIYFASLKTEEGRPLQLRISLVDPKRADPDRPPRPRPDRWRIIKIHERVPFTVPSVVKLAKAADPWSSCMAVYFDSTERFFIWGLVDQTVHFNTMLVRETESGYAPPGIIHILATGAADLSVYREHGFIARLAQDSLLKRQNDVFWSGPISDGLSYGVERHLSAVFSQFPPKEIAGLREDWTASLAYKWKSTLCRLLISIQRYRHGGALLLTRSYTHLDIKYKINYSRLYMALARRGVSTIKAAQAHDEIFQAYIEPMKDNVPVLLYLDESIAESDGEDFQDEITGCVRFISSLSCVDGLILATPDLSIKGFGVEIREKKEVGVAYMAPSPKARGKALRQIDPNHYGTRHRSMMRYCMSHPGSVGFVISQDGEIRAITRVGTQLVIWENLQVLSLWEQEFRKLIPARLKK
jgi:hypothetical protein